MALLIINELIGKDDVSTYSMISAFPYVNIPDGLCLYIVFYKGEGIVKIQDIEGMTWSSGMNFREKGVEERSISLTAEKKTISGMRGKNTLT